MKLLTFLLLIFCSSASFAQSTKTSVAALEGVEQISDTAVVNGYTVEKIYPNPFSPVIEPKFNLSETSWVSVFITDTLLADTAWIIENQHLATGEYKIPCGVLSAYSRETGNETPVFHLEAKGSSDDIVGNLQSHFHAIYVLHPFSAWLSAPE